MPKSPKVSVLIPTYEYARYLPEAIESVLGQAFDDYEIIVSDDASSDDSSIIAESYAKRDTRIEVTSHKTNFGMVANWNWCLRRARGKYIKFLFGDDCLASPRALGNLVKLLDEHSSASIATSSRLLIDENSRATGLWDELGKNGLHEGRQVILKCLLGNKNLIGEPSAVLFRRSQSVRGYEPHLKQIVDMEMWFHLLLQGDLAYSTEPLCAFRRHGTQQTAANRQNQVGFLEMVTLIKDYLPRLTRSAQGLDASTRERIVYQCLHDLQKKKLQLPQAIEAVDWLKTQFGIGGRHYRWAAHRLKKPMDNTRRLLSSRRTKARILSGVSEQIAFLKQVRTSAVVEKKV